MNKEVSSCVQYFKNHQGFKRAFLEMKKKWKSQGKIAGKIKISNATEQEKKELGSFFGKKYWDKDIEFTFVKFEETLRDTKFGKVSVEALLEGYFGEKILSNQECKALEASKKELFWQEIEGWIDASDVKEISEWIHRMQSEKNAGCSYVMSLWKRNEGEALFILKSVCRAIELLLSQDEAMLLAVLAAKVSGNPHFFDRGQAAAQLLMYAICELTDLDIPRNAEELQQMYQTVGVELDELSSTIIVYGIHIIKKGKLYTPLEEMEAFGEAAVLSMANLHDIDRIYAQSENVFVVENEMVYSRLLGICRAHRIPILCTSGQLSRAAQKVLRLLCEDGRTLYYSGDTDPEGLRIADSLWSKYPHQICVWRMSEDDYKNSISNENIGVQSLEKLRNIKHPSLVKTAEFIRRTAKAGYQENILESMENDILQFLNQK